MEAFSPPPRPPEPPEVTDAPTLGGWVWVILFGMVMGLSVLANLALIVSVAQSKKKQNVIYLLLIGLFAVNLVDYALLIFEFSLGLEHEYPHGHRACVVYQTVSKGNPIIQSAVVVTLVFYASSNYVKGHKIKPPIFVGIFVSILAILFGLLAIPTATFAKIVSVEGKKYCEIEISGGQKEISVYYLIYSAILSYWLPLLLSITPMIRLAKVSNSDKYPEVTVTIATAASFFLFYSLHGTIVMVRHAIDALGVNLDSQHTWMIKVAQSLLWLVAYFWHVTRPLLAFLMDTELKLPSLCPQKASLLTAYDLVEGQQPRNNLRGRQQQPLKVLLSADEAELTSLKLNSNQDSVEKLEPQKNTVYSETLCTKPEDTV